MKPAIHPETGEVDWREFHARIAKAFDSSAEALKPSDERARQILEERARHLAKPIARKDQATSAVTIVTFKLGQERYGLETRFVQEVVQLADITHVPGVPDFVRGVTNIRGDIVPVFDLIRFFGLPQPSIRDHARTIIVGSLRAELGIFADAVLGVAPLASGTFQPDAKFDVVQGGECIRGITRDAVIILDGAILLRDQRLFIDSSDQAARRRISSGGENDA